MRIRFRENQWLSPVGSRGLRRLLTGTRAQRRTGVQFEIPAGAGSTEDDAGMQGVCRGHAAFASGTDRFPVARGNRGKTAARANGDSAAVLLRTGHPVREAVVGGYVID